MRTLGRATPPMLPKKRNSRNSRKIPLIERNLMFHITAIFRNTLRIRKHENPHNKGDVPGVPDVPDYPATEEGDEIRSSESPPVADERDVGLTADELQMIEELARSEVRSGRTRGEGDA